MEDIQDVSPFSLDFAKSDAFLHKGFPYAPPHYYS